MDNLSAFDRNKAYFDKCDLKQTNFNLLFNKYPKFDQGEKEGKFIFYKQKGKGKENTPEYFLGSKLQEGVSKEFFDTKKVREISGRYYEHLPKLGYHTTLEPGNDGLAQAFELCPDWRMAIGLGNKSVYEVGMTLHHIYGFPYIPGTAIKGIAHHYASYLQKEGKLEQAAIDEVFGIDSESDPSKEMQKGKIIFFDAFPTGEIALAPDIMNNHYPDYYGEGQKPPADWQSPRPIFFLTVKKPTAFKFVLGCKPEHQALLATANAWLHQALTAHGIGAKTAVGYGYMS
jgi:CRISPR type III-B/RAMP module RAMP protein Cmr6